MSKYRLPAEWEKQEAVILSWPHQPETWSPEQLLEVEKIYIRLIQEISEHQEVWVNVRSEEESKTIKDRLSSQQNIRFFINPTHDAWVRDYGPISVYQNNKRLMTKWQFNGWGAKYEDEYFQDGKIPYKIASETKTELKEIDFILEGGSIEVNGLGTLITSTDCLLNANRNQSLSKNEIEAILCKNLGITKVIWAQGQIKGDDTDGHIDDAVRFVGLKDIVCISEDNPEDSNFEGIATLHKSLKDITDQDGNPINITKIPMPDPVYYKENRLPASYANFLITNKKIFVPIYNCEKDKEALQIISKFFPDRKTIGIDCTDLVAGFGSIHCVSMQVTRGS